jgi:hypothetical protein
MLNKVINVGAFTQASADIINQNFDTVAEAAGLGPGKVWYVNANGGGGDGTSWDQAFGRMTDAFSVLSSGDTIFLLGQVKEELMAPLGVSNVRVIGAGTLPRYGNESSFLTPSFDAASAWRPPTVPTAATPLLVLRQQGWVIDNILFDCPVDAAAIQLHRAENATFPDPSHATIQNCRFTDGKNGIEDVGGCADLLIQNNVFQRLTGQGIVVTSTGIAVPLQNRILNNLFQDCDGGIVGSYAQALIAGNIFQDGPTHDWTQGVINTIKLSAQGQMNFVINNYTFDAAADIDPAHGYTGSATDVWRTFGSGTVDPVVTSPPS